VLAPRRANGLSCVGHLAWAEALHVADPGTDHPPDGQELSDLHARLPVMNSGILLSQSAVPAGGAVLNPFVIVDDAAGLVDFVSGVFGIAENAEVRTQMPDGKLIHAQLRLDGVDLMIADRLEGWPLRPGLLQV
jgi:hypothetical protein